MKKPIVLALVPSDNAPNTVYKISLDQHNVVFCSCPSWRYRDHSCKHLTVFRATLTTKQVA